MNTLVPNTLVVKNNWALSCEKADMFITYDPGNHTSLNRKENGWRTKFYLKPGNDPNMNRKVHDFYTVMTRLSTVQQGC